MGNCTSASTPLRPPLSPEVKARHKIRKTRSQQDMQREVAEYHNRPQAPKKFEKLRPTPISIENPATEPPVKGSQPSSAELSPQLLSSVKLDSSIDSSV